MRNLIIKISFAGLLGLLILPINLKAEETPTRCYQFTLTESPANSRHTHQSPRKEVWCYQQLSSPSGVLYIYNADDKTVRPELSMLIDTFGFITHGSLLAGSLTTHKVDSKKFNPYSIPTEEPKGQPRVSPAHEAQIDSSAQENLKFLLSQSPSSIEFSLQEGTFSASTQILPWRGYWWPYKGAPLYGSSSSPLAKYDRFVRARTGRNPGAQSWESANHRFSGTWWEGHCNGWAASSVLRAEPRRSKTDPLSGVTFTVADQKGILSETDYCANVAFFGRRYRGRPGDNIRDIDPATFHRTLVYYIGQIGKPVSIDYRADSAVDNHVISGYRMTLTRIGSNTYSVTTVLKVHKYDGTRSQPPGVAPSYSRTYRYTLRETSTGLVGSWRSLNPDFLWVPLSIADCGSNNPRVSHATVQQILNL